MLQAGELDTTAGQAAVSRFIDTLESKGWLTAEEKELLRAIKLKGVR
jgi:hypothetical protein